MGIPIVVRVSHLTTRGMDKNVHLHVYMYNQTHAVFLMLLLFGGVLTSHVAVPLITMLLPHHTLVVAKFLFLLLPYYSELDTCMYVS